MHVISSIGDARDPATWSGTPCRVVAALEHRGHIVATHVATLNPMALRVGQVTNVLRGLGHRQATRTGYAYHRLRNEAGRIAARLGPVPILHFGSTHLPLTEKVVGQRHFLFTDYSVSLLVRNPVFRELVTRRYCDAVLSHERTMLQQIDAVFTTSDYVREALIADYDISPDRVVTVGTGLGRVPAEAVVDRDFTNAPLLFVAKFNFINKGGELLLDAFDIVRQRRPETRLAIVGNRADPAAAPNMERMLNTPGIDFHNFDTPNFQTLVREAALYVGPAPDEPWGIIYLEAQAAGTPVLMLDRNAAQQFTDKGRCGILVSDSSAQAVAAAILEALAEPERLQALGAQARAFVTSRFTWENVADAIISHIES